MTPTTYTLSAQREMLHRVRLHAAAKLLLPISVSTLSKSDAPRNPDRTYRAVALVEWYVDRQVSKALALVSSPGDEMSGHITSPALERYRSARASQEQIKLAEMKGEKVPADLLQSVLMPLAERFRKRQEALRNRDTLTGADAVAFIEKMLSELIADISREADS